MTERAPCMATDSLTWNWCPEHKSKHIYVERGLFFCAACEGNKRVAVGETASREEGK